MSEKKIAVVILNWNGSNMLRRFLPSVVSHSPEARIVVADNGSEDDSLQVLHNEFSTVDTLVLDRNYGFAEGYNRALEQVNEPYSLLLNSDVEVTQGWLRPMLDFMEEHPEVDACQPKILAERQRECFEYAGAAGGFMDAWGYTFCRGRLFHLVERDNGQYNQPMPVFWATGAALMVRTDAFRRHGGLDGRFFAHMEEIDFCWRLRSRGRGLYCIPQSVVYHVGGATLSKSNPRKTFLNFRNNLLMIYKNASPAALRKILLVRFFLDYLAAFQMCLQGRLSEARAVVQARREFRRTRHQFDGQRSENLRATVLHDIPEMMHGCLLWKFYVRRQKTFSALHWNPHPEK
ncbi:MAG: glycosyltransferase family 2 protein [Bacteroidaceae bacterium]|nr:glycosyltransferase family 2 protein [Bacteroidaceae bacterium]